MSCDNDCFCCCTLDCPCAPEETDEPECTEACVCRCNQRRCPVTGRPTDDELFEIGSSAWKGQEDIPNPFAAERRALEFHGYKRGYYGCLLDLRAHEAARIVSDRLGVSMSDVEDALAELADKMENPGSGRPVVTTE